MDSFWNREPSAFQLIRWLFYIIVPVIGLSIILLFVLEINDTKTIKTAQIVAKNTPSIFKSQIEAKVMDVRVREGEKVRKGDTLLMLYNSELQVNFDQALNEVELINRNIESNTLLLENMKSKLSQQRKQKGTIKTDFDYQKKAKNLELEKLRAQLPLMRQRLALSKERLDKDYVLFQERILSELEFSEKHKLYLEEQQRYISLQKRYEQSTSNYGQIDNNLQSKVQEQQVKLLNSEQDYFSVEQKLLKAEISKMAANQQLELAQRALDQSYVLAEITGEISYLYNTNKQVNFVKKGTKLFEIKPDAKAQFYARLQVPQVAISNVEVGQDIHLKLEAYDHFKYGVLKGKVKYIAESDTTPDFQITAEIMPNQNQFELKTGYQARGEIILKRIKLYRFMFNSLFSKT